MKEAWRAVPDKEGYEVSNLGRIRSLSRTVNNNGGRRTIPTRVLSQWTVNGTGYRQVDLAGVRAYVHRAVASAWCEGYFDGAHVDHINGNRSDNRACNLQWVTASENVKRGFDRGRASPHKGRFSASHPTSKRITSTCLKTGKVTHWQSGMDAVRAGFSSDGISRCCNGKAKSHRGHRWEFSA